MDTTSQDCIAVYSLRTKRSCLDQLSEIAAAEHRTLAQKLRVMIETEIASDQRERRQAKREPIIHHVCGDDCSTPADLSATEAA